MSVKKIKIGVVIVVCIIGCILFLYAFGELTVHTPLKKADAIILLAGNYKERAPAVAMLFRDGYANKIVLTNDGVFSSWSSKYMKNLYQIEWAEEELVKLGVPRDSIVKLPFYGSATYYDAVAVKRYLFKSGYKILILVTSDYHTRRTLWIFKHALKSYTTDIMTYPAKSFGIGVKEKTIEYVKLYYYMVLYGVLGVEPDIYELPLNSG